VRTPAKAQPKRPPPQVRFSTHAKPTPHPPAVDKTVPVSENRWFFAIFSEMTKKSGLFQTL